MEKACNLSTRALLTVSTVLFVMSIITVPQGTLFAEDPTLTVDPVNCGPGTTPTCSTNGSETECEPAGGIRCNENDACKCRWKRLFINGNWVDKCICLNVTGG